jgi:hypothetical protein
MMCRKWGGDTGGGECILIDKRIPHNSAEFFSNALLAYGIYGSKKGGVVYMKKVGHLCKSSGQGVQERGGTCYAEGRAGMQEVGCVVLKVGQRCMR